MTEYSANELEEAIYTCVDFLLTKKERVQNNTEKRNILDVMKCLYNKDGSKFTHRYPHTLLFKMTSGCNLRCKHCFYSDEFSSYCTEQDLDEETLFGYLRYFVEEINILCCTLTGGEIFTVPYLIKFLKYLKSKNIIVELLTNGTLIKDEDAVLLSRLLNHKTDSIQISLEGPEEVNDFIRGKGVFKKVKQSIKLLTDKNIRVCVSMTINSLNACYIEEMYDLCRNLKVEQLNIGRMQVCNETQAGFATNVDDLIISLAKTIKKAEKYKDLKVKVRALKAFDFLNYQKGREYLDRLLDQGEQVVPEENMHCRPLGEQVSLFPTGNLSLCYNCECDEFYIGNLKEQSFEEIWANRHNKTMFKSRPLMSTCKKCKYVHLCNGGCPISAYNKYKTINCPDGNCLYAEDKIMTNEWQVEEVN